MTSPRKPEPPGSGGPGRAPRPGPRAGGPLAEDGERSANPRPGGEGPGALDSRLSILHEVSLALNSTLEPDRLIDLILDLSIRYTGATTGSVILITDASELSIVAARGLGANVKEEVRLKVGEGITGWVALHGKPLNVPDVAEEPRYVMVKEHIRSELAVPMILNNRVIGVISVDSTRAANFTEGDLQLLSIVGTQAAQILENARSFAELQRKVEQDGTLLEISQALGSTLHLEELFKRVMEILSRRCHMDRGFLVLSDLETDELAIEIAFGLTPEEVAKGRYRMGEGIVGTVFRSGKPYGAKDIRLDPQFVGKTGAIQARDEAYSFIASPVILEGQVIGVFGVVKAFAGTAEFEDDMALVQIVASTLAQAVRIHRGVAREKADLIQENRLLREELGTRYRFSNILGTSSAMQRVFSVMRNVAPLRSTVLIRGESGTGKELIARAIHFSSPRAEKPFIRVNCAAIPEGLLEAELFGHVKGSFTGAVSDRKGKFLMADGGTIFLDEIGDMPLVLQAKILRVLQEREVEAVGGETSVKVDLRVIAATHQDLEGLIREKKFREDLYYRLHVVPIFVPPLRERIEDLRLLVEHFLDRFSKDNGVPRVAVSPEAMRLLLRYTWPGNVRQLANVLERAIVLSSGEVIRPEDLSPELLDAPAISVGEALGIRSLADAVVRYLDGAFGESPAAGQVWDGTMRIVEDSLLKRALEQTSGVRLQAADWLGIHRNTLRKKLEEPGAKA